MKTRLRCRFLYAAAAFSAACGDITAIFQGRFIRPPRLCHILIILSISIAAAPLSAFAQYWILQPNLSDEFNYPEGTSIDLNKWYFQTDAHFNGEAQQYTNLQYNVPPGSHLEDYNLKTTGSTIQIVGRANTGGYRYTSIRINSQCRMAFTYARMEFRMRPPDATVSGLWPAVWMLGNQINQSPRCPAAGSQGWPGCGEVDLWEYQSSRSTSYITNGFCGSGCGNTSRKDIVPGNQAGVWRIYCAEWSATQWKYWYRNDGEPFDTVRGLVTKDNAGCSCFKRDMFYLINLAIGGTLGGAITCTFPQILELDYIRTYKGSAAITSTPIETRLKAVKCVLGNTVFRLSVTRSSPVRVTISDMNGKLVKVLVNANYAKGTYDIPWNGRTDGGSRMSGIFVASVKSGDECIHYKVVQFQ